MKKKIKDIDEWERQYVCTYHNYHCDQCPLHVNDECFKTLEDYYNTEVDITKELESELENNRRNRKR